jgi:biopolymer transport protein ExbD/biopolymer transport protein TolR
MTTSLKLELPKTDAGQPNDTPQFITVALDPQGRFYFGEEAVDSADFTTRVTEAARRNPQTEVQLRADRSVPYGRVAELIGIVQKAGLTRSGFVTEPPEAGKSAAPDPVRPRRPMVLRGRRAQRARQLLPPPSAQRSDPVRRGARRQPGRAFNSLSAFWLATSPATTDFGSTVRS